MKLNNSKQEKNSYRYFCNKECEYYPCHKTERINCIFCFCPKYNYDCGGNFKILKNGKKDCSGCNLPHEKDGYDFIVNFLKGIK
jgi:Zn-finger protein